MDAGIFCNAFGIHLEHIITFHDVRVDADAIMILDMMKTATRGRRYGRQPRNGASLGISCQLDRLGSALQKFNNTEGKCLWGKSG